MRKQWRNRRILSAMGVRFIEGADGEPAAPVEVAPVEGATPPAATSEPSAPPTDGDEQLGENGLKALRATRTERDQARDALKPYTDLGLSPDELRALIDAKPVPVDESALEARYEQAANERYAGQVRDLAVTRAAVLAGFSNPDDAIALADADAKAAIAVTDGKADAEAAAELVKALATSRPYLLAQSTPSAGAAGIGTRGSDSPPPVAAGRDRIRHAYNSQS